MVFHYCLLTKEFRTRLMPKAKMLFNSNNMQKLFYDQIPLAEKIRYDSIRRDSFFRSKFSLFLCLFLSLTQNNWMKKRFFIVLIKYYYLE